MREFAVDERRMEEVISMIEESKEIQIKSFLLDLCYENEEIAKRLIIALDKHKVQSIEYYKEEIDHIVRSNSMKGVIDCFHGTSFTNQLTEYIDNNVDFLIQKAASCTAFEIILYAGKILNKVEMDGSNGEHIWIVNSLMKNFEYIFAFSNKEERRLYFDKINLTIKRSHYPNHLVIFFERAMELYDESYNEDKLKYYKNKFDIFLMEDESNPELHVVEYAEKLISFRSFNQFEDLYVKWSHLHEMKFLKAKTSLERFGDDYAIDLLKSFEAEENLKKIKLKFASMIKDIYSKKEDKKLLIDKLLQIAKDYSHINYEEYCLLKKSLNEQEWLENRSSLLDAIKNQKEAVKVYFYEREYMRILEFSAEDIKRDRKAWEYMRKHYSEEFLSRYESTIYKLFEKTAIRKNYRRYAQYLYKIAEIPGGLQKAKELKAILKGKYPHRTAMVEELDKIKL